MKFLPAAIASVAVWFLISAQQPQVATEGYSSALSGINWLKVLASLVPLVLPVIQGGKFDWRSILSLFIDGVKPAPTPTPEPLPPGPTPEPRPIIDLFRQLLDALVTEGRFGEAQKVFDLCECHAKENP